MSTSSRCADLSHRAGEALGGTASTAEHWLLVEAPGTWSRDVADGEGLPEAARRAAREWLEHTPSSRLLFIRRPARTRTGSRLVFVVHAGEGWREVHRIELAALEELADLGDATSVVTGSALVLVCGHGARDACCARRGTAVHSSLAESVGADELWISSHQGGHRFAANVLVLPHGIQLGRMTPAVAPGLVARALTGRIALEHFRGRSFYTPAVQAADIAVRNAFGLDGIDDLRLLEATGDRVRFRDSSGREHVAAVEQCLGPAVPASCGATPEPQLGFSARIE